VETWVVALSLIGAYVIVTLLVGLVANRRLQLDLEDFLLYGRRAGFFVLYLTVVATYHSAFAFLGSGGFFYTHGIGFWVAGTWAVMTGAITFVLGPRIWALGKKFDYMTPADMLADFYESEVVRMVVAAVSIVFTIIYVQVQALGLGYVISAASGDRIPFEVATAVLLVVAATYLMAGGLRAVYWTDILQGAWMYVAVWAGALYLAYELFGGPVQLLQAVREQRPDLLTLPGPQGFFTYPMWFSMMITLSFGIVLQPHIMIRYYTAIDARTLKWLGATIPIFLVTLFIPTALVGLGGALIMPGIAIPDRIFPELLFVYAPAWLTGFILAGATAAAMSTLDSILHANTAVLTRDIYQRYIRVDADPAHYVAVSRVFIVSFLLIGYILTVYTFEYLVVLVVLSAAGTLQLLPAVLGVTFPTRMRLSATGVVSGMAVGLVVLFFTLVVWPHPLTLHGGVWGLLANGLTAVLVSRQTKSPSAATVNRIHGAIEELVYGANVQTPGAR
jgi:SSS family solute:Na+ symporter